MLLTLVNIYIYTHTHMYIQCDCNEWKTEKCHERTNMGKVRTTQIMLASVRHVVSRAGCLKFQATWFLLGGLYICRQLCPPENKFTVILVHDIWSLWICATSCSKWYCCRMAHYICRQLCPTENKFTVIWVYEIWTLWSMCYISFKDFIIIFTLVTCLNIWHRLLCI